MKININNMKYTDKNFRAICEVAYNLTGLEYYLNTVPNMVDFWSILNRVRKGIADGQVYKYPLISLATGLPVPYIGNSLKIN